MEIRLAKTAGFCFGVEPLRVDADLQDSAGTRGIKVATTGPAASTTRRLWRTWQTAKAALRGGYRAVDVPRRV